MKKFILAAGLFGFCAVASAQNIPSKTEATQALQNAMQREIQAMDSAPQSDRRMDSQSANNVVRTLEVKSIDNCRSTGGSQGVACDVRTSAQVRGSTHEDVNKYHFYQQAGRWEARLPSAS